MFWLYFTVFPPKTKFKIDQKYHTLITIVRTYPSHHIIKEEMLLVFWSLELGVELESTLFLVKPLN